MFLYQPLHQSAPRNKSLEKRVRIITAFLFQIGQFKSDEPPKLWDTQISLIVDSHPKHYFHDILPAYYCALDVVSKQENQSLFLKHSTVHFLPIKADCTKTDCKK